MGLIFLATLGQRPEALTVAFDVLCERYHYDAFAVLTTDPERSGIAAASDALALVAARDYPSVRARWHILRDESGVPLVDITDRQSADDYYRAVLGVLFSYKQSGHTLHLLVAGGRKAMSIYAMLAAGLVFAPPQDKVWTVISSETLIGQPGQFHVPPGARDQVQIIDLPMTASRLAPGIDPRDLLDQPPNRCRDFLEKLTRAEREVAELLRDKPYASNEDLARMTGKVSRTIENQLKDVYQKMAVFFEFGGELNATKKRAALTRILNECE